MDPRFKQQKFSGGYARGVVARARAQGNAQMRNKADCLNSGNDPPDCRKNSSVEASGALTETSLREEMSKEKKINHQQPSVIARLMGLDSMPSPCKRTERKEFRSYSPQKTYKSYHGQLLRKNIIEHQEFKDVFEIKDSKKIEKHKEYSHIKGYNLHVMQEAFIKQKFIEAKHLSTDENFHGSKEFVDALEVLDSNRDILLKFLEEPNTLSTNYLSRFPLENQIKVSKLSKGKTRSAKSTSQTRKGPTSTLQKPNANLSNRLFLEHGVPLSHKLEAHNLRKISSDYCSTNAVVLKPDSEKTMGNPLQLTSQDKYFYRYEKNKQYQYSGIRELHSEGNEQHGLLGNVELLGRRTKSSQEIAGEIAMKRSAKKSSTGFNRLGVKDESSHVSPGLYNSNKCLQHFEAHSNFSNCFSKPSFSYSDKSFFSKEGKKHISERWRLNNHFSYENQFGRHFTLNEILSLTGKEEPAVFYSKRESYHSGLGSNYTRKYQQSTSIPRSSSLIRRSRSPLVSEGASYKLKDGHNLGEGSPSDSKLNTNQCSSKCSKIQNKPYLNPVGLENKEPVRANLMNEEELKNGIHTSDQYVETPILSNIANSINVLDSSSFEERNILDRKEHVQQHMQELESSVINHTAEVKEEISPKQHPHVDNISSLDSSTESKHTTNRDAADNSSPVSVLSESSPKYFSRVSAGLQEHQNQLQLLRESNDSITENDSTPGFNRLVYENEDDRDSSYVADALALSIPHAYQNSSADHDMFLKLEGKYSKCTEWSKPERKLLFDITNNTAEAVLYRSKREQAVFDCKPLNEVVWEMVSRLRKEPGKPEDNVLDPKWLDLEDEIHMMGRETAGMLMDDLLEECVSDFVYIC